MKEKLKVSKKGLDLEITKYGITWFLVDEADYIIYQNSYGDIIQEIDTTRDI